MSHPALTRPEIAEGAFRLRGDGTLLREQTAPTPETAAIGEGYISIRRPGEETPRVAPLPEEMSGVVALIRAGLAGDPSAAAERLLRDFDAALADGPDGWTLALTPRDADARLASIELSGCGGTLRAIAFAPRGGGASRRIVFGP